MLRLFLILIPLLAASTGGLWRAGKTGDTKLALAAAAAGALILIIGGVFGNALLWKTGREAEVPAARLNSALIGLGYAWGAASMFAVYLLSGLKWQHGWQYGAGMAVIAAILFAYSHALATPNSPLRAPANMDIARVATALHAIAAAIGLLWLLFSGKLETTKGDWAANDIFMAGGFTVTFLSDLALATRKRLMRPR